MGKLYNKTTSLSKLLVDGSVPVTQTAFTRYTATPRCCIRNENERRSAVELAMRRPSSWRQSNADCPTAPRVFTAMDVKSYSGDRLMYFDFFFSSASFTTALEPWTALLRWFKASVSGQVKSHTMERPRAHGTIIKPSDL